MEVKVYREKENLSLLYEEDDLKIYYGLAEELGIIAPVEVQKRPNIYQIINEEMKTQLTALCPSIVEVTDYKRSTIPIEVLQVLKFVKDNEMFEGFEIWYNDKAPDPMLVGWKYRSDPDRQKGYTWNRQKYLIARWGDCALEIEELCTKGFSIIKQKLIDKAIDLLAISRSILDSPDTYTRKHINNELTGDFRV